MDKPCDCNPPSPITIYPASRHPKDTEQTLNRAPRLPRNCINCDNLGTDNDGGDPGYSNSWPVCDMTYLNSDDERDYSNMPGFPFRHEMPCHQPGFWQYMEADPELNNLFESELQQTHGGTLNKTYERFRAKYLGDTAPAEAN